MAYLVTYYAKKKVIKALRQYNRSFGKFISNPGKNKENEEKVEKCFDHLIRTLNDGKLFSKNKFKYDLVALDDLKTIPEFNGFLNQEMRVMSEATNSSKKYAGKITYMTMSHRQPLEIDNVIETITAIHYHQMDQVTRSRCLERKEKKIIKRNAAVSILQMVGGASIGLANNTLPPLMTYQRESTFLGIGVLIGGAVDLMRK